jgi:hypothetical protein
MKNKISSWVHSTIIEDYQSTPEEYRLLYSTTTHEIRAIAASSVCIPTPLWKSSGAVALGGMPPHSPTSTLKKSQR